jgi:large subunit ribosomal protein L24
MKFKKGDKVIVISGSFKGVSGEILKSYPSQNKLLVKGAGLKTKYVKSSKDYPDGGMFLIERPIDASSVSHLDPKTGLPTRVGYKTLDSGVKVRYSKRSGELIDNAKVGE